MSGAGEFIGRFTDLYNAGSYADALALVTREFSSLPHFEALLLCYSAAMSARLGDTAAALADFRTALDRGYWYHEGAMRNDPDFASLQAETEFQDIVARNALRRQAALASVSPMMQVLEPVDPAEPAPLLIAIHHNLGNLDEFSVHWQSAVRQGWRVAMPRSSHLSWLSGFYEWRDLEDALQELEQHYQMLVTNYAVDPSRVFIAGFSRGGLIAERAAITRRLPVRGLLWIEGSPDDEFNQIIAEHQPFDFRAYFAAGQSQDFLQTAALLSQALGEVGVACRTETMPSLYHDIPDSFAQTLDRALEFLCS